LREGFACEASPDLPLDKSSIWTELYCLRAEYSLLEKVVGKNPNYTFKLSRKAGALQYRLDDVGTNRDNLEEYLTAMIDGYSGIPWSYYKNLSNLVKDSGFELQRITREQRSGKDIIRLVGSYNPPADLAVKDVNIILDPDGYWCIIEYSDRVPSWGKTIGKVEYANDDQGFPVPMRYTVTQFYDKGEQTIYETTFEGWKYRRDGIPKEVFYLSAFGLPEPLGAQTLPPSRSWLWLLAAAIVAVALEVLFAWLKRRHTKTDTFTSKAS
jgi:hypothetical protein